MQNIQKQKYQAYATATQTVAKTKQIVMLYDGVISLMQQAKDAIREKRIEDRYNTVIKATEIIMGLQGCLDFEKGGNIARILYGFYSSVDNRMFAIHRTNSIETCDEIINDMKKMRDVWAEIDQSTSAVAPVPVPVPQEQSSNSAPPAAAGTDQNITLSA